MPAILIVERDRGLAELMGDILRSNNDEPVLCEDDAHAHEWLRQRRYALVIGGDGTAPSLGEQARTHGARLLVVTADLRRCAALEKNGEACVMRPFKIADFLAAVGRECGPPG